MGERGREGQEEAQRGLVCVACPWASCLHRRRRQGLRVSRLPVKRSLLTSCREEGNTARLKDRAHLWTPQCLGTELGLPNRKCCRTLLQSSLLTSPGSFLHLCLGSCMTATPGCDLSPRAGSHKSQADCGDFLHLLSRLGPHTPVISSPICERGLLTF